MATNPTFTNTDRAGSLTGAHDTGLYDPNMHENQIVAMYETVARANSARDKLVAAGVSASSIRIVDQSTMGSSASTTMGSSASTTSASATGAQDQGLWGSIKSLFAPDDDLHGYAEGVHRGHAVLTVVPTGTVDRSHVIQVLESTDPVDFDAKLEEWRQAGYTNPASSSIGAAGIATGAMMDARSPTLTGATGTATTGATVPPMRTPAAAAGAPMTDADTIKVVEERLRVGKREVAMGGVRVRSYVVERPVEEQVRLHEERVTLERHPVDRPVTPADEVAFRERTIEVRATGEEAIVAKEARVVEEIGIKKESSDRTETIRDTVRRTEVEVDDALQPRVGVGSTSVSGASVTGGSTTTGTSTTGTSTTGTSTPGATTSGMNAPRK